eukprot:254541_1
MYMMMGNPVIDVTDADNTNELKDNSQLDDDNTNVLKDIENFEIIMSTSIDCVDKRIHGLVVEWFINLTTVNDTIFVPQDIKILIILFYSKQTVMKIKYEHNQQIGQIGFCPLRASEHSWVFMIERIFATGGIELNCSVELSINGNSIDLCWDDWDEFWEEDDIYKFSANWLCRMCSYNNAGNVEKCYICGQGEKYRTRLVCDLDL